VDQVAVVSRLLERDLDVGPLLGELAEQSGEDTGTDALVGADAERTGVAGVKGGEVGVRCLQPRGCLLYTF
jgi:hypothetical protein